MGRVGDGGSVGYQAVFADRTAWRLWAAATVSFLGDFVGLGALLLAGYERSGGHPLGSAAVFGIQAVPAFAVSAFIGPWLDRIPRRSGLIVLSLAGAVAISLPIAASGLWAVLVAAAMIGAIRTAYNSIRSGAMADSVPRDVRAGLVALIAVSNQVSEVLGYVTGSAVAIVIGTTPALAADAATFVAAAALLAGLRRQSPGSRRRERGSMTAGVRAIFADRTLSVLAPVVWIGVTLGAVPQTLAAAALSKADRAWVPVALAGMAAGQAIAATVVGRTRLSERVLGQFWYIALCGIAFLLTAALLQVNPALLVAGNFAIGLAFGWVVAANTTFIHVIPGERMAHVASTMVGSLIVLEGAGSVAFAAVAGAFGVPAAYLLAGAMVTVAGLAATGYGRSHPQVLDVSRPAVASPEPGATSRPAQ